MAVYPPTPALSETDKRLLVLMAKLLLEQMDSCVAGSNLPAGVVALTDQEAEELLNHLEDLVRSREFLESCYFVEGLTLPGAQEEARVREIYLSSRKRRGRSRALASTHWSEFQVRVGIARTVVRGVRTRPMSFDHFREMERRLLSAANLHPRVIELILQMLDSQADQVDEVRTGRKSLPHGTINRTLIRPFLQLGKKLRGSQDRHVPATKIAAVMTLVADISVLFTTRDWGVAGTLSTMAAALTTASSE